MAKKAATKSKTPAKKAGRGIGGAKVGTGKGGMKKGPAKKAAAPKKAGSKKASPAKAPASGKKSPGAGRLPMGVFPVSTGDGASPVQIAQTLVKMFNSGQFEQIEEMYWSPEIVSCEGLGVQMEWRGLAAVRGKNEEWMKDHVIHGARAIGPFVGSTGFAVRFEMDVETKSTGTRERMDEVGVYTVRDGKIVREEFMYLAEG